MEKPVKSAQKNQNPEVFPSPELSIYSPQRIRTERKSGQEFLEFQSYNFFWLPGL